MSYFVYILRTSSNTLYIGQTNDLNRRIKEHNNKSSRSAKYIRYFSSFELVYHEKYSTRSEAMKREIELKKLAKKQKETIIAGDNYSPYNINLFNEYFYKHAEKKLIDALPNLFTKLDLFNIALNRKIISEFPKNDIKVIELASGNKMDKWNTFVEINNNRKWQVLLTDFDKAQLPSKNAIPRSNNFKFTTGIYSLFDNFPKLGTKKRRDVILSTYTFDNLWLKDDLHLIKVKNTWYYKLYKLQVNIRNVNKDKKLGRQYFKNIKIKTKKKKIELSSLQYGSHIERYYKKIPNVSVNYPGGLIDTVKDSFKTQLKKSGLFITADIATDDPSKKTKCFKSVNGTIRIKIENYTLAKFILEKLGFNVELNNLHDFIKDAGVVTPIEIFDHFVLIVKSKQ